MPFVDDIDARRQLSVLNVRIATPCSAKWSDMIGDDRVRACAACNKSVFDISNMTRVQAEALIVEKEGRLCLRYYQRADGTIMLKDCSIATTKSGRRIWVALGGAAIVAGAAIASQGPEPQLLSPMPTRVEASAPRWRHVPELTKAPSDGVLLEDAMHATGGVASFFARDSLGEASETPALEGLEDAPHLPRR